MIDLMILNQVIKVCLLHNWLTEHNVGSLDKFYFSALTLETSEISLNVII